uniref:Pseudouridylate synthase TRUB1 n=2 Tax=Varanus komodoensis TaxID=61221 RepID=A0A8D2J789_VARKO
MLFCYKVCGRGLNFLFPRSYRAISCCRAELGWWSHVGRKRSLLDEGRNRRGGAFAAVAVAAAAYFSRPGTAQGVLLDAVMNSAAAAKLRSCNGLFAVYKPKGPTSSDVLNRLKGKLFAEAGIVEPTRRKRKQALKFGHGGILDSNATGVLVVGIGKGTRMLSSMLAGSKKYTVIAELGKATDTFDSTGQITEEKPYDWITKEDLEAVLQKFTGNIMQVPPVYSALKKDGQRLSDLVRKGEGVEAKPARLVTVYSLTLKNFEPPLFTLDVECGSGFYVRSLVNDIGKELSSCATVQELTRTKQGPFTLEEHALYEDKWTIDEIAQSLECCMPLLQAEPSRKKLKTELSEEHTMSSEDK